MTSTEDSFIFQDPSIPSGSTTFEEDDVLFAHFDVGVCSSSPLPTTSTASLVVPCPLSIDLPLSDLPELEKDSLAVSTAAAIAASNPSTAVPSSLSIQLPTVSWTEAPAPGPQQQQLLPVVTPRSPDATRSSPRKKKPSKKAAAAKNDSALTTEFMLGTVSEDSTTASHTSIATIMSQQNPRQMVAPSAVQSSVPPPPAPQSASNPSHHHHIHQQPPPPTKPAGPPVQENTGRWTAEEHRLFLQGLEQHGKGWKKIASLIKSRTVVQIRTHAQKYFQKLAKARQNGEQVGGVMDGSGAGVGGAGGNHHHQHVPMATRDDGVGGASSGAYPHVSMRTVSHHDRGNMSIGTDPTSLAAAAGHVGIADSGAMGGGRKRRAGSNPGGSTKRRAIGSVVRSSVREGRTAKRQSKAAQRRNKKKEQDQQQGPHVGEVDIEDVPNPLPSISNVLDPYMPLPPPPGTLTANVSNNKATGRNQLVNTATHNALPMAALEDAV